MSLGFDTTSSNTGHRSRACLMLERKLGKELLHSACRHYVLELGFGAAFNAVFGKSTSPKVALFTHFKEIWSSINVRDFSTAADDFSICEDEKNSLVSFARSVLTIGTVGDDYREFLELLLLCLDLRHNPNEPKSPSRLLAQSTMPDECPRCCTQSKFGRFAISCHSLRNSSKHCMTSPTSQCEFTRSRGFGPVMLLLLRMRTCCFSKPCNRMQIVLWLMLQASFAITFGICRRKCCLWPSSTTMCAEP